ncbi:hypothetical protein KIH74_17810 [Kineosporia sp. J2-2]|uniref:DUF3618 domain-containing protein n=1 Tax=Kineosporia corallincola TaxID=2835133 RepID=A0ABS5TK92_9ACTN|nr:hypothetical protein [Kineosporia corallincola]MBT0770804.1 hypothetical protein [Kineosporia corallincola]
MADEFGVPTRGTTATIDENSTSTTDVAKEQAAGVGQGAVDAGRHVAGVAGEQASQVASEAAAQARNLYQQSRDELRGQAAGQQERLAGRIRSLGSELGSMAERSEPGIATDLVREVSGRANDVAGWLDQRDPGGVLRELTDYARRRPGTFLAIAAGAGLVAGRLTRGAVSAAHDETGSAASGTGAAPVAGSTGAPVSGYPQPTPAAPTSYTGVPAATPAYEAAPYERYEEEVVTYPERREGL